MQAEGRIVLQKLLDRLMAGLLSGPSLNCRPHNSRQRLDLTALDRLQDKNAAAVLRGLLGPDCSIRVVAKVAQPPKPEVSLDSSDGNGTPQRDPAQRAWLDQQAVLTKLRNIAEDAKMYEQDTGAYALSIGFPLLSLPPSALGGQTSRRILAPVAFIPVSISVRRGVTPGIELSCRGSGTDRVIPNVALMAWLEQLTKRKLDAASFDDLHGDQPWREIQELTQFVAQTLEISCSLFGAGHGQDDSASGDTPSPLAALEPAPRADDQTVAQFLPSAVIGLFPMANQGLIDDMKSLAGGEVVSGPIESFLKVGIALDEAAPEHIEPEEVERRQRNFSEERLITDADPCQAKAVRLARECRGLVVHGPPGTGKSQTIVNMIGDHLARGERVLVVCDKRTALDVVYNRLDYLQLGELCAIVHDPQRDQREFYKSVRSQLDDLAEASLKPQANRSLDRADAELRRVHQELSAYHHALMDAPNGSDLSLHDLMGRWLALPGTSHDLGRELAEIPYDAFRGQRTRLEELFKRALSVEFATNPWRGVVQVSLQSFLDRPMQAIRDGCAALVQAAEHADSAADPLIPPFDPATNLQQQGRCRGETGQKLQTLQAEVPLEIRSRWAGQDLSVLQRSRQNLADASPMIERCRATPLDFELLTTARSAWPSPATLGQHTAALAAYSEIAGKWYSFVYGGRKKQAREILSTYGLPLNADSAQRLKGFLEALRERMLLTALLGELSGIAPEAPVVSDDILLKQLAEHRRVLDLVCEMPVELRSLMPQVLQAIGDDERCRQLTEGLNKSPERAEGIAAALDAAEQLQFMGQPWLQDYQQRLYAGETVAESVQPLNTAVDTLENVLRVEDGLQRLHKSFTQAAETLVMAAEPADRAIAVMRKAVLQGEIQRRLKDNPHLQASDPQHLQALFDRYRQLDHAKREMVRDSILNLWLERQKQRLLSMTGTRLNSMGADLKRRLTTRGQHSTRLRKVIELGSRSEGGDPLFDLRPVWMASPETVAQLFPREAIFDVVIFDEASQCRLEEALPVLTRGKRLVVAGDQKQLPPTRFFESTIVVSENEEAESDQELFEAQQSSAEDLLSAALHLEIQESYLDVHYRSRNADLIEFSNEQFYHSRLQAIPGHPRNRTRFAPLTLVHAGGIYDKGTNEIEGRRVVQIVRDLLKRASPPSIGIACMNVAQRDTILDLLDEAAEEDREFASRLADARSRRGDGSFEGLFVKNLENVQGDERDHIIISTTYGPNTEGKFYRRFGPLLQAGGGRRLNVLVTRAKQEVHLVTSIPPQAYRTLPPPQAGQVPNGGWLLFSYLKFAEELAEQYELAHRVLEQTEAAEQATVNLRKAQRPSAAAQALAYRLRDQHNIGSDVHWGNEGFCVDLALHHPNRAEDVTIGILCDGVRYQRAEDATDWDVFRTAIHESQGWKLHRVWTPHLFRDPAAHLRDVTAKVAAYLASEVTPDGLPVANRLET